MAVIILQFADTVLLQNVAKKVSTCPEKQYYFDNKISFIYNSKVYFKTQNVHHLKAHSDVI